VRRRDLSHQGRSAVRERRLATLQALLEDAKQRGATPGTIEAQIKAAEGGIARAERRIATLRARIGTAERALPADPRDRDEEA